MLVLYSYSMKLQSTNISPNLSLFDTRQFFDAVQYFGQIWAGM
jgi:hypothetical protein